VAAARGLPARDTGSPITVPVGREVLGRMFDEPFLWRRPEADMTSTKHAERRSKQRGIGEDLIDLAADYGRLEGDRIILGAQAIGELLEEIERYRRMLLRARDKGGLAIVLRDERLITTFPLWR